MKYLLLLAFILFSCDDNRIKLVDKNGKTIGLERRVPIYNQQILERQSEPKKPISNYKTEDDGSGSKYYSTGRIEIPIVPKDFKKIDSLAPVYKKANQEIKKDESVKQQNGFISLDEINFNENKHLEYTKKILLDKQNILTESEYKPEKVKKPIALKAKNDKIRRPIIEKPKPPVEAIDSANSIYFIKVLESKSIIDISDKIKEIRTISGNSISIEQNKKTNNYQLIIGPISKGAEAKVILNTVKQHGYKNASVVSN